MNEGALVVAEVFGPTFQGEGPSAGRLAMFVRLGRCNLDCSWCDTPYTWDWSRYDPAKELRERTVGDLVAELDGIGAPQLVVTGGEPLLQQRPLEPLLVAGRDRGWRIEIETNGTIAPLPAVAALVDGWNVSPKLANSGVAPGRRDRPDALRALVATGRAVGKFVVARAEDLDEVAAIVAASGLLDVWIMPEATDGAALTARLSELAPLVLARGWNLSNRLHVQLWGDARGV